MKLVWGGHGAKKKKDEKKRIPIKWSLRGRYGRSRTVGGGEKKKGCKMKGT